MDPKTLISRLAGATWMGVLALGCAAASGAGAETVILTKARDIAAQVTPPEAEPSRVALEAVVTFQDPTLTIFLRDETGVTFVRGGKDNPRVRQGERLRIEGVVHNGLIIGGIKPGRIERLEEGPVPEPEAATPDDLTTGRLHYHWIAIGGVGRTLRPAGEYGATLRLNVAGRTVELRFDEAPSDGRELLDAELRVKGLAAGDINDRRELVRPYVRVRGIEDVEIVRRPPADPFAAPVLPLGELARASAGGHRVKVRGLALGPATDGGLFLRGENKSVFAQLDAPEIRAGDEVDVLGFPEMGNFSAQLADAECRVVSHAAPPAALEVTARELADGTDADLIRTEAEVLQRVDRDGGTEFAARLGAVTLTAFVPMPAPPELQSGSLARFTGLARVVATKGEGYRARPTAYRVWLRGVEDLVLVRGAPWWTVRRLVIGLTVLACVALLALSWIALLRRQVAKQLAQIQVQAEAAAVHEERRRIAREFHDTLEQELAGLSLRLDAAATRVTDEKARSLLEQQRRLLTRLQTETRDFVWDLRDPSRNDLPLAESLRSLLTHLQSGTAVRLELRIGAPPPELPPLVKHHLLRIAREAVNNAIKYARADAVRVGLDARDGVLLLSVRDEGAGFDSSRVEALEGHFGIRGMRERAGRIGAALRVESREGAGTTVELTLPLGASKA